MVEVLQTRLINEITPRFRRLYELNRLEELLDPQPQDAARQILERIQLSREGSVNSIFSLSMFSGKTTAAIDFYYMAKEEGMHVIAVQPKSGLRYGEQQETEIITHKRKNYQTVPAILTNPNLQSVLEIAKQERKKVGKEKFALIIDETMLYTENETNLQEAEDCIEQIRTMGIDVIPTGITRTYQTTPFPVMDHLVNVSPFKDSWGTLQMTTECAFCPERAQGTALYIIENDDIQLAPLDISHVKVGGVDCFLQVCVVNHPSFRA